MRGMILLYLCAAGTVVFYVAAIRGTIIRERAKRGLGRRSWLK